MRLGFDFTASDLKQLDAATAAEEVQVAREVSNHRLQPGELVLN